MEAPRRTMNILMIGNSSSHFFTDELYFMLRSAGVEARVSNITAAGCTLREHWTWHEGGERKNELYTFDQSGRSCAKPVGLDDCLSQCEWDVISYQDGERHYRLHGPIEAQRCMEPYLRQLTDYVRGRFPHARHYYHQVWAYQIGYSRADNPFRVLDEAAQAQMHRHLLDMCLYACRAHSLLRVPTGDAWQIARSDPRIGDVLCLPDCVHDCEEGGGQYLNACVWFETLLGISCVGHPYRPDYPLAEEKIAALQRAAHEAVSAMRRA